MNSHCTALRIFFSNSMCSSCLLATMCFLLTRFTAWYFPWGRVVILEEQKQSSVLNILQPQFQNESGQCVKCLSSHVRLQYSKVIWLGINRASSTGRDSQQGRGAEGQFTRRMGFKRYRGKSKPYMNKIQKHQSSAGQSSFKMDKGKVKNCSVVRRIKIETSFLENILYSGLKRKQIIPTFSRHIAAMKFKTS